MEILAHRGQWVERGERNTFEALISALHNGYGLETDIRDLNGELVISHDMPTLESCFPLEKLLQYYSKERFSSTLALNIKSDGLQERLRQQLTEHEISRYFVFDMSIPDTLGYMSGGFKTFVRRSDIERHPELTQRGQGIWLDELIVPWIDATVITEQAKDAQSVCIVSAELHGRNHLEQWLEIEKAIEVPGQSQKLMICTDFPREAERFHQ